MRLSARGVKRLLIGALMLAALAGVGVAFVTIPTLRGAFDYAAWLWTDGDRSMTRGLVDVRGASLYYQRSGHGPTIVLLHGGGVFLDVCFAQIPHLAHLGVKAGDSERSTWRSPALSVALLASIVALAGPTWERNELPAFASESPTVLVLSLAQSMNATDLSPNRLTRADAIRALFLTSWVD